MMRAGSVAARVIAAGGVVTPVFVRTHADLSTTVNYILTSGTWIVDGTNKFLLAFFASSADPPADPASIYFGTNQLTKIGNTFNFQTYCKISIYSLTNPPSESSASEYTLSDYNDELVAGTILLTGVNQTIPLGSTATNTGTGNVSLIPTVDVASAVGDLVVAATYVVDTASSGRTTSSSGGSTVYDATIGTTCTLVIQTKIATGATTTMNFSITGAESSNVWWGVIGVAVKPI